MLRQGRRSKPAHASLSSSLPSRCTLSSPSLNPFLSWNSRPPTLHYLCNGEIGIIKKKHSQIELLDISYSRLVDVDITTRCLLVQSVDLLQLLIGQSFLNLIRKTVLSFSVLSHHYLVLHGISSSFEVLLRHCWSLQSTITEENVGC